MKKIIVPIALAGAILAVGVGSCAAANNAGSDATTHASLDAGHHAALAPATHKPKYTLAERNAIGSAKDYLATLPFSKAGLIHQLSSKYGSGYKHKDAVFAVNHIKVNWNKQATRAAKGYLSTQHFSRSGLIHQLSSKYGDRFTHAQAVYGVNHVGLR